MKNNNGNIAVILAIGVFVIIALGFLYFRNQSPAQKNDSEKAMQKEEKTMEKGSASAMYKGNVLAGDKSQFIEFTQEDYEKALAENKIIILDFYANWCPICRGEAPDLHAGFDQLDNPNVVGFRVNYNDDQTDDAERDLAKQFGIVYQHTKVILKNGSEVLKSGEVWDTEKFLSEVSSVL